MNNNQQSMYKDALMQHFKYPYNKHTGPFAESFVSARGSNPKCGDDIEVGIEFTSFEASADISKAGFRGRGCSVCLASASMMVKAIEGMSAKQAHDLAKTIHAWVENTLVDEHNIPEDLQALEAVKNHPARKKCVMLAWNALHEVIESKFDKAA